mmetsp:Transcript_30163/g.100794  ORF Transcript_30163/g.100794 Transcript_30163/m.100794 type:complete len:215 (-) Transcript_30163:1176-1820(-)
MPLPIEHPLPDHCDDGREERSRHHDGEHGAREERLRPLHLRAVLGQARQMLRDVVESDAAQRRLDGGLGAPRHHPEELLGGAPAVRADAQPAGDRPAGEAADDDDEGPGDEGRTQQGRVHARAEKAKDDGSSVGGPAGSEHAIRLGDAARLRRHPGEHALAQRQPHHHHREAAAATHVHPLAREEEDRRPANQEAVPVRPVPRGAPHREASRRA